jgi:hypothetical protein
MKEIFFEIILISCVHTLVDCSNEHALFNNFLMFVRVNLQFVNLGLNLIRAILNEFSNSLESLINFIVLL